MSLTTPKHTYSLCVSSSPAYDRIRCVRNVSRRRIQSLAKKYTLRQMWEELSKLESMEPSKKKVTGLKRKPRAATVFPSAGLRTPSPSTNGQNIAKLSDCAATRRPRFLRHLAKQGIFNTELPPPRLSFFEFNRDEYFIKASQAKSHKHKFEVSSVIRVKRWKRLCWGAGTMRTGLTRSPPTMPSSPRLDPNTLLWTFLSECSTPSVDPTRGNGLC